MHQASDNNKFIVAFEMHPDQNSAKSSNPSSNNDKLEIPRPFEWLTSSSSLKSILSKSNIFDNNNDCDNDHTINGTSNDSDGEEVSLSRKALHVGCGTSILGEYLVQDLHYQEVVNVDIDKEVLNQLKTRWDNNIVSSSEDNGVHRTERNKYKEATMDFVQVDLSSERVPYPSGYFDLVVDKSTLDCTLCSDEASAGLLCEAYRSLKAAENDGDGRGGVYAIVSFHHKDLLLPMLQNLPGAEWTVEHQVIARQVEDLISNYANSASTASPIKSPTDDANVELPACSAEGSLPTATTGTGTSSWSDNGEFEPNEQYRRFVNVFICQKKYTSTTTKAVELDRGAVCEHIHKTNDEWFQAQNPMLTKSRIEDLRLEFGTLLQGATSNYLDLKRCYGILFTDAEREHLTFDYFLEDWRAFLEEFPNIAKDKMTFETACKFLQVMQ